MFQIYRYLDIDIGRFIYIYVYDIYICIYIYIYMYYVCMYISMYVGKYIYIIYFFSSINSIV